MVFLVWVLVIKWNTILRCVTEQCAPMVSLLFYDIALTKNK